jgi:predicted RNA binding protein YcfA (HicA-like mRNA interferase family)
MDRYLRDRGFTFEREGGKHRIYRYGNRTVSIPRGKSFKHGTVAIVERFLKQIGSSQSGSASEAISLPAVGDDLMVPESACEPAVVDENTTTLPPGLYEVFKDFVHFCEINSDKAGEYEIRDILMHNGHQLPDWNSLLHMAQRNEDVSVIFDLQDALELMKIKSIQLQTIYNELDRKTAPANPEPSRGEKPGDTQAARFVIRTPERSHQPNAERPKPVSTVPPAAALADVSRPGATYQLQSQEIRYARSLSPKQQAYLEIIQILGRLDADDGRAILQHANGFLEMG